MHKMAIMMKTLMEISDDAKIKAENDYIQYLDQFHKNEYDSNMMYHFIDKFGDK